MSDICERCGCPEGVDGHDVLYRQIDEMKEATPNAINNLATALGTMDADERGMLCKRIEVLERALRDAIPFIAHNNFAHKIERKGDMDYLLAYDDQCVKCRAEKSLKGD